MKLGTLQPRMSLQLVAGVLLTVATIALLVGVLLIDNIGERLIAARQASVADAARDYFVGFAHEEGLAPLARALDRRERQGPESGFRYALFSSDGQRLGGANLLAASALPPPGVRQVLLTADGRRSPWRVTVQPISTGGLLVVYEDVEEREAFRRALLMGASAALGVALAAVVVASLAFNRLLYRRAEAIAHTAGRIAAGELSARAPADPKGDVFDVLGVALNTMLARNEELLVGMRTVTDSLAHDLRSPLTRMRAALARAQGADSDAARDAALEDASEEAERALATTSALLDIARAETGVSREAFERVDLQALACDTSELFAPLLEDEGQTLQVVDGPPAILQGHPLLMRQAIGNLLHNAARYGGPGAAVRLEVLADGEAIRLVVADNGPGIPEASRGRVVERFTRGDEARTTPGSGLGLAIAAACAKLHGGALRLEDNEPGLRAVMELKRSA